MTETISATIASDSSVLWTLAAAGSAPANVTSLTISASAFSFDVPIGSYSTFYDIYVVPNGGALSLGSPDYTLETCIDPSLGGGGGGLGGGGGGGGGGGIVPTPTVTDTPIGTTSATSLSDARDAFRDLQRLALISWPSI